MHHLDMISEEDFLELSYTPSEKHSHPDDLRTTIMLDFQCSRHRIIVGYWTWRMWLYQYSHE